MSTDLDTAKRQFAKKYTDKSPFEYGILAALQHGRLYSPGIGTEEIRSFWKEQLEDISEKYIDVKQSEKTFIEDVGNLKAVMNARFPGSFNNGSPEFENGFRIAHAQKSLSVCLKHMWCRGLLKYAPPVCPIDGIVLRSLGCPDAWTRVNHVYEGPAPLYIDHLNLAKAAMKKQGCKSLSEWELLLWNEQKPLQSACLASSLATTHPKRKRTWLLTCLAAALCVLKAWGRLA